ncbi:MAG: hypothetical protein PHU66_03075 [Bacteroidaceae bacterium]|nr:hypothetical protein [Bacteroidaceae bacterium]
MSRRNFYSAFAVIFIGCAFCVLQAIAQQKTEKSPRIVNIINFIRGTEPRIEAYTDEVLYQTVVSQANCLRSHGLKGTYLLQYDALINPEYQKLLKEEIQRGCEVGGWWEITQPQVEAAGLKWRGRYSWDWHTNVGFSVGYTPKEREQLVDAYMKKFKEIFGTYPASIGSWFIDAHSLAYMYDKYRIQASCNCRDQVGTDGYTLWGGYWGQGFYPSRKNAYMPAQTKSGQIDVPIFRMLGSDPIYQYEAGLGGAVQSVATLEPVYGDGGGSPTWVDWFFKTFTEDPCLGFNYTQAGQENSFTWGPMQKGFEYQMEQLEKLSAAGKVKIETLGETGRWYKKVYPVTPATSFAALSDHKQNGRKTVWFNSRYYRANLLWDKTTLNIRDIHLFDERSQSEYLEKPTTSTKCLYRTFPIVDGCLWSTVDRLAGLRFYRQNSNGEMEEVLGGNPSITEKGKDLLVSWPLQDGSAIFILEFKADKLDIYCQNKAKQFNWNMQLTVQPEAELPFSSITSHKITASQDGFSYKTDLLKGSFKDLRNTGNGNVFSIQPEGNRITLFFNTTK